MKKILVFFLCFMFFGTLNGWTDEYEKLRDYLNGNITRGSTQKQIAHALEVDASTISRFVRGETATSPKILRSFKSKYPAEYNAFINLAPIAQPVVLIPAYQRTHSRQADQTSYQPPVTLPPVLSESAVYSQRLPVVANSLPIVSSRAEDPLPTTSHQDSAPQQEVETKHDSYKPSYIKTLRNTPNPGITNPPQAAVVIPYRQEGKERGKAAFYDHYTTQRITHHETRIACPPELDSRGLAEYCRDVPYGLLYGQTTEGKKLPILSSNSCEEGLLLIPGRMRENEYDSIRSRHETDLINKACNRGQPILAICAGSWQLWQKLGGSLQDARDHVYSRMVGLSKDGKKSTYNVDIHRLSFEEDSMLASVMKGKPSPYSLPVNLHNLTVNSVHWRAPDETTTPTLLKVVARSIDDGSAPNHRTGNHMEPDEDSVEAFESQYGAPLLGIQWHPEAYFGKDFPQDEYHLRIVRFMAQAGDAYAAKRKMIKELEGVILNTSRTWA